MSQPANAVVREIRGHPVVEGVAQGPALVSRHPISFLGDLDITTGRIVGKVPGVEGKNVRGTVLVIPDSMGSAGAWRFLYQLFVHGNHPVAIVSQIMPDPSLIQGAILAKVPIVCQTAEEVIRTVHEGDLIEVDGGQGIVRVTQAAAGR